MSFTKIGSTAALSYPPLPISLPAGQSFILPAGQGIQGTWGGSGAIANQVTGSILTGQYMVTTGPYSVLQFLDPILGIWRNFAGPNTFTPISSDGTNFRIANSTGCPVGAVITNAGSSLTNGFNTVTVTPSAGASTWNTIVGGAINTTVALSGTIAGTYSVPPNTSSTVTACTGGSGYTKPPILVFVPPAGQGSTPYILPTATCTISGGAINAVTVVNQGAGLVAAPYINVLNAPGDTTGGGAVLGVNLTLAGSGTLLWMGPSYYGTAVTAVPTFTFSPASTIAATAVMNFSVTGVSVANAGVAYTSGSGFQIVSSGAAPNSSGSALSAANTNPFTSTGQLYPRPFAASGILSGTTLTLAQILIQDFGFGYQGVPLLGVVTSGTAAPTTIANVTATVGGVSDTSLLQPI